VETPDPSIIDLVSGANSMPKYEVVRTFSVDGWVSTTIEADSPAAARAEEERARSEHTDSRFGLPSVGDIHIEAILEDVESVDEVSDTRPA
ncbi:MAG TPA: hypothetical protein VFG74_11195, partial [Miltoncostaeaceae bacterium]|nr:hypothetical protein [Miltoncostaeaceae bacterium]